MSQSRRWLRYLSPPPPHLVNSPKFSGEPGKQVVARNTSIPQRPTHLRLAQNTQWFHLLHTHFRGGHTTFPTPQMNRQGLRGQARPGPSRAGGTQGFDFLYAWQPQLQALTSQFPVRCYPGSPPCPRDGRCWSPLLCTLREDEAQEGRCWAILPSGGRAKNCVRLLPHSWRIGLNMCPRSALRRLSWSPVTLGGCTFLSLAFKATSKQAGFIPTHLSPKPNQCPDHHLLAFAYTVACYARGMPSFFSLYNH
jgi:hypothetical protein